MPKRKLEDLNLMDDFLINRVMSDTTYGEEFARILLGIIFHRKMGPLSVIPQKVEYGTDLYSHGIRLDVYMDEKDAGIYDLEAEQNFSVKNKESLPRRVRFYHAKIDATALESGLEYKSLRNVCVIFITTYDPFNKERMVYTIKNCCTEEPGLTYEDGARTIFLYTKGSNGNPPADLVELLRYMEDTTEKNVCNESIKKLHEMVQHTKQDAKAGVSYMKWYEIQSMCREEGREEGKAEGEISVCIRVVRKMLQKQQSPEEISQFLEMPVSQIEEIGKQLNVHSEWSNEQILEEIRKQEILLESN